MNVRELTDCLKRREYNLLLTDIQIPGADCFSVLELLAAVLQMDNPGFMPIMEGKKNKEEILDISIEDTTEEFSEMLDVSIRDYEKSVIHKATSLWEVNRINIHRSKLKEIDLHAS